jgi:uncharacterized Tic20 family protein
MSTEPQSTETSDERTWALAAHLSFLLTYAGVGLGLSWIAPLVIWLVKKEESSFIEDQAKEALNFQLSVWIVCVVCGVTCILAPLALVVVIGATVYCVIAAMEANKGQLYRYPYTFRLIK